MLYFVWAPAVQLPPCPRTLLSSGPSWADARPSRRHDFGELGLSGFLRAVGLQIPGARPAQHLARQIGSADQFAAIFATSETFRQIAFKYLAK